MARSNRRTGKQPATNGPLTKKEKKLEQQRLKKLKKEKLKNLGFMFTDTLLRLPRPTLKQMVKARKILGKRQFMLFHYIRCGTPAQRRFAQGKILEIHKNLPWGFIRKSKWNSIFDTNQRDAAIDIKDAVQAGQMGILHASEKFNYTRGVKFSTCAWKWIRHYVQRLFENGGEIRLPVDVWKRIWRYRSTLHAEQARLRREPSPLEIKEAMGLTEEEWAEMVDAFVVALHRRPYLSEEKEDSLPHESVFAEIVDTNHPTELNESPIEELLDRDRLQKLLHQIIHSGQVLKGIEGGVLWHRLGLGSTIPKNGPQTGQALGCSKQAVNKAEERAYKKLLTPGRHQEILRPYWN
jgi:RNA polymerase primary sigma factor